MNALAWNLYPLMRKRSEERKVGRKEGREERKVLTTGNKEGERRGLFTIIIRAKL